MSFVIFDFSQFLIFSCDESIIKNGVAQFESLGMKVLLRVEIVKKKLTYLSPFLQENVIELFDQEFVGVFEDWMEEENLPIELSNLKSEISEFCSNSNSKSLKLIIISCVSLS